MCYTGKCPYENHDNYECTLPWGTAAKPTVYPDDAHCVLMEKAQELDAAGLLGDIDIDDTDTITAAYKRLRSAIDALKEDACKSA